MTLQYRVLITILASVYLVSCESGSSSTPESDGKSSSNTNSSSSGSNATGYAVFSAAGTVVRVVNLANWAASDLPIATSIWPSFDGTIWGTYDTKRRYSDNEDDLNFFDGAGKLQLSIPVLKSLHGRVQISPDKSKLAIFWANEQKGESYTNPTFTIFDLNINILYRNINATSFTWFPNGDILYSESSKLYRAGPVGQNRILLATLPSNPSGLAVSRSGRQIAFSLRGPRADEAHTFALNSDGTNFHQISTSSYVDMDPTWVGENDEYLLIREMVSVDIQGPNGCPSLYLVPSTAGRILNLTRGSPDPSVVLVQYKRPKDPIQFSACPYSQVAWVPR